MQDKILEFTEHSQDKLSTINKLMCWN